MHCVGNDPRSPYSRSLVDRHSATYSFHSAPGFAVNIKIEACGPAHGRTTPSGRWQALNTASTAQDSSFTLHNGALTVDGSFITEVHIVAETGREAGELIHAAFRASELNAYNTGLNMVTGFCGKRAFFLGPGRSRSCGNLVVQVKHSSASRRRSGTRLCAATTFSATWRAQCTASTSHCARSAARSLRPGSRTVRSLLP